MKVKQIKSCDGVRRRRTTKCWDGRMWKLLVETFLHSIITVLAFCSMLTPKMWRCVHDGCDRLVKKSFSISCNLVVMRNELATF